MMRPCCRHLWVLPVVWLTCANFSCSGSNTPAESVTVVADTESDVTSSPETTAESLSESPKETVAEVSEPTTPTSALVSEVASEETPLEPVPSVSAVDARRAARRARERWAAERRSRRRPPAQDVQEAPEPAVPLDRSPPVVETPAGDESVVAIIGDYQITGKDFHDRMLQELSADPYEVTAVTQAVTPGEVIRMLLAEKAIAMEARKQGVDKSERVLSAMVRFNERELVNRLGSHVVSQQVSVTEDEIERYMKDKPKLNRTQAEMSLRRNKARSAFNAYTSGLTQTLDMKKVPENFAKAAQIHDTLRFHPKKPRSHNASWILRDQILNELASEDAAIVLATFEGGQFTVKDLLMALHAMSPPGRPRNLGTEAGIEAFLLKAIRKPLQVTQAKAMKLDQSADFLKKQRAHEDGQLYSAVQVEKRKEVVEPNEAEIDAYYQTVKAVVGKRDSVKAKVIWCRDRAAAESAKAELVGGKPFPQVQQKFSIDEKDTKERNFYASSEGFLWPEIWAGEPNDIVGPLLGLHTVDRNRKFDWRVLQLVGKEEGSPQTLDDNLRNTLKWGMQDDRSTAHFRAYAEKTLAKYAYTVIEERLKAFDPRNVP